MTFTAEALMALLTLIGAIMSFGVHLLISINGKVSRIATAHEVAEARTKEQIESLKRHQRRNEEETERLRRHMNLPPSAQPHHI